MPTTVQVPGLTKGEGVSELTVPFLRGGKGRNPAEGGCILQVIDWIDRQMWTDTPPCVHPILRGIAITANDELEDEERQKLLDLAPRLMGTGICDHNVDRRLFDFLNELTGTSWDWEEITFIKNAPDDVDLEEFGYVVAAKRRDDLLGLLTTALDKFDHITQREPQAEPIDFGPVCRVMA